MSGVGLSRMDLMAGVRTARAALIAAGTVVALVVICLRWNPYGSGGHLASGCRYVWLVSRSARGMRADWMTPRSLVGKHGDSPAGLLCTEREKVGAKDSDTRRCEGSARTRRAAA